MVYILEELKNTPPSIPDTLDSIELGNKIEQ